MNSHPLAIAACAFVMATATVETGHLNAASHLNTGRLDQGTVGRIERYCTTSWQNAGIARQDWTDCTQEALLELLQRVDQPRWRDAIENSLSEERRELNRTVWCIAQRWRRAPRYKGLDREPSARPDVVADDAESVRALLDQAPLTEEQRQVLSLWTEGHSVAEISARLQLPAPRISDLKFKALRKLREAVA